MEPNDQLRSNEFTTPPDNNLAIAIISTILCCWPIGIFSIIKATKVNTLWKQGDHAGAQKASEDAKKFAMYSAIAGVALALIYIIMIFVFGVGGALFDGFAN